MGVRETKTEAQIREKPDIWQKKCVFIIHVARMIVKWKFWVLLLKSFFAHKTLLYFLYYTLFYVLFFFVLLWYCVGDCFSFILQVDSDNKGISYLLPHLTDSSNNAVMIILKQHFFVVGIHIKVDNYVLRSL